MTKEYVTSDHHFHHSNIIKYCNRPFDSVEKMNSEMIERWNKKVNKRDIVYHLGDLTFKGKEVANSLNNKLNGKIVLIRGNHDSYREPDFHLLESCFIKRKGIGFKYNHRPETDFEEWLIHGHKHNNDLYNYPFYHPQKNRINVSVEVTEYEPILIDNIISLIKSQNKKIEKKSQSHVF